MSDKRILHIISVLTLVALVISFFSANVGRIIAFLLMVILCGVTISFIKKRSIPSFVYSEIVMIMAVIAAVYVMLYYLTGLSFGFAKLNYGSTATVIFKYILPTAAIIVSTELMRVIMRAQEDKSADILSYFSCVVAEILIYYTASDVLSFKKFIDLVAMVFFPAILSNLLYHYLAKRYTALPNIVYRLIITLHTYVVSYATGIPDSLLAFVGLMVPIAIYLFIDFLYEKKKKYALSRPSKLGVILTVAVVILMCAVIMLVSNAFRFGAYVIATDSMTGELNKGDIAIYERYDEQEIEVGSVIVFSKNGIKVVHRVVEKSNINGQTRYYTKGDVNESMDSGYITDGDITGLVNLKLPYFGYPTLWLRELIGNAVKA